MRSLQSIVETLIESFTNGKSATAGEDAIILIFFEEGDPCNVVGYDIIGPTKDPQTSKNQISGILEELGLKARLEIVRVQIDTLVEDLQINSEIELWKSNLRARLVRFDD